MKIQVEDISSIRKKISVVMPREKVGEKIENAYGRLKRTARIKGFRPGKAPRNILEKHYREQVLEEVLNDILKESYPRALEEGGVMPVAYPHYGGEVLKEGEDFAFTFSVDVKPGIEPKGYEGVRVKQEKVAVSDDEVNGELERLRRNFATFSEVEGRGIEKGDVVTLDFEGFVDGKAIERGKAENSVLEVGSGQFIPGFEEGLVGMKQGEKGEVKAQFPADYNEKSLAGKEALFSVHVKEIKKTELPPLDDDFAKDVGEYETLQSLKERIAADMKASKEENARRTMHRELVDALLKENTFDVPASLVQGQAEYKKEETERQMTAYGMPKAEIRKRLASLEADIYRESERQVKSGLLLEAIAEKEGITIGEADLERYYREMAEKSGRPIDEVKRYFADRQDYVVSTLMDGKILDFLVSKAKITS